MPYRVFRFDFQVVIILLGRLAIHVGTYMYTTHRPIKQNALSPTRINSDVQKHSGEPQYVLSAVLIKIKTIVGYFLAAINCTFQRGFRR